MPFHAGLDWGGIAHAVCVVNGAGQIVARIEACHDEAGTHTCGIMDPTDLHAPLLGYPSLKSWIVPPKAVAAVCPA